MIYYIMNVIHTFFSLPLKHASDFAITETSQLPVSVPALATAAAAAAAVHWLSHPAGDPFRSRFHLIRCSSLRKNCIRFFCPLRALTSYRLFVSRRKNILFGFPFYKWTAFIHIICTQDPVHEVFFDFSDTVGLSLRPKALSWTEYPTLTDCPTDQKQFDNNRAPGIIYSSSVPSVNVLSNLILEKN